MPKHVVTTDEETVNWAIQVFDDLIDRATEAGNAGEDSTDEEKMLEIDTTELMRASAVLTAVSLTAFTLQEKKDELRQVINNLLTVIDHLFVQLANFEEDRTARSYENVLLVKEMVDVAVLAAKGAIRNV